MTKKLFIAMAKAIRERYEDTDCLSAEQAFLYREGIRDATDAFVETAKADNPRFDADKFLEACGIL